MTISQSTRDDLTIRGRLRFGHQVVTAADLVASSGLLLLRPDSGAMVRIEAGATLRGIQLLDYESNPESDLTDQDPDNPPAITLVCSSAVPWLFIVTDEDLTMTDIHRFYVPTSANDGTRANGAVTNVGQIVIYWRDDLERWFVPWSAL